MNRHQISGFYSPTFLRMHIDTNEDINLLTLSTNTKSTLLHEYVHYIQDLSTIYGLWNICVTSNKIKSAVLEKIKSIPVSNNETIDNILSLYEGTIPQGSGQVKSIESISVYENGVIPEYEFLNEYTVNAALVNQKKITFSFGAKHIVEGMAYLIERHIYPNSLAPSAMPYEIPSLIIQQRYPDFHTDVNTIVLCDLSLNSLHPAEAFFLILDLAKEESFIPKSAQDMYNWFETKNISACNYSIPKAYRYYNSIGQKALTGFFTSNHMVEAKEYYKAIFQKIKIARTKQFGIWAQILDAPANQREAFSLNMMNEFGMPVMTNNSNKMFVLKSHPASNGEGFLLMAIQQVMKTILDNSRQCGLTKICIEGVNQKCLTTPWENIHESKLCPYAVIVKSWGLSNLKLT